MDTADRYESVEMETVPCNLCGGSDLVPVYRIPDVLYHPEEWFTVVECRNCGLGFVNPRPTQKSIDRYYPDTFFDYFKQEVAFHNTRYAREAGYLTQAVTSPEGRRPQLLDVGCANGDFPRFMRGLGWDVEGVEIASNSNPIDDFPVYRSLFPDISVSEPRYDAVTAWAVLEHVHDPQAYFRKASQVLNPGGIFIFLATNFDSLSSRRLYREDVPRHLYFFNKRTAGAYLDQAGLAMERSVFNKDIYEMAPVHWLRHYLRRTIGLPPLEWADLPESRLNYCNRLGIGNGIKGRLQYALTHPLTTIDRVLMPAFARLQMLTDTYGTSMFIARKAPVSTVAVRRPTATP